MAYKIVSSTPQKLILERESAAMSSGCFIAIGSLFFVIGVGLNFFMTTWEMPFLLFRILFPLFGLGAVFAGAYLPRQMRETQPVRITFDHDQGAVVVEMMDGDSQKGFIRYDELDGFDIYVESRSSSSSSRGTSRTTYRYHVYLKKKDGGEWHLFDYGDRTDAEAMIVHLNAQIPTDRPFKLVMPAKLSSKIERKEGLDKTVIHWQNKVTFWQPLFLFVFAAIFLTILSSFFSFGTELDVFFMIVIGFIFSVFVLVMFTVVRKLIKDATTRYAVSVDHVNLEYYEFAKSSGAMRNKKILPLVEVRSINYTFAPSKQYQNAGLRILTEKDEEKIQEYKEKPLKALKDLFSSSDSGPITLSITALNPVECLQLENWLQELILKKSNVKVQ
jgi:membrane protein YdbS with pleckstrin-like domain